MSQLEGEASPGLEEQVRGRGGESLSDKFQDGVAFTPQGWEQLELQTEPSTPSSTMSDDFDEGMNYMHELNLELSIPDGPVSLMLCTPLLSC